MGKFRIEITKLAQQHLAKHYKSGNKPTIKKKLKKCCWSCLKPPFQEQEILKL